MSVLAGNIGGALLLSFLITVLELTEVVAIVYALGAGRKSLRHGALGSASGVAVVGAAGLVVGVGLSRIPVDYTLIAGAVLLYAFGFFLLRSTVKTYFKEAKKARGIVDSGSGHEEGENLSDHALFAAAFSVGAVETTEAVIVLVAVAAGGYGWEALVGFAAGAILLLSLGIALHERIRRIKVPPLKWIATSLLFTFAVFWTLESLVSAGKLSWPSLGGLPPDILILPIFVVALGCVKAAVTYRVNAKLAVLPQKS